MKLLTPELEARFAEVGRTSAADPLVICKFFDPTGRLTFYAFEYDAERRVFFGWMVSPLGNDCDELGYAYLDELEALPGRFGLGIERDLYWEEKPLSVAVPS